MRNFGAIPNTESPGEVQTMRKGSVDNLCVSSQTLSLSVYYLFVSVSVSVFVSVSVCIHQNTPTMKRMFGDLPSAHGLVLGQPTLIMTMLRHMVPPLIPRTINVERQEMP